MNGEKKTLLLVTESNREEIAIFFDSTDQRIRFVGNNSLVFNISGSEQVNDYKSEQVNSSKLETSEYCVDKLCTLQFETNQPYENFNISELSSHNIQSNELNSNEVTNETKNDDDDDLISIMSYVEGDTKNEVNKKTPIYNQC